MTSYSRDNPSPRYFELIEEHRKLHMLPGKIGDEVFSGTKMIGDIDAIKKIIDETSSKSILDYGSGKGRLYLDELVTAAENEPPVTLQAFWNIEHFACYDPCYPPFNSLPEEKFDGVICIDVLEHCPEEDIPWILKELFGYAKIFVYANIACGPAMKTLPNGKNVHATVREPDWWKSIFSTTSIEFPEIEWHLTTTKMITKEKGIWVPVKHYRGEKQSRG